MRLTSTRGSEDTRAREVRENFGVKLGGAGRKFAGTLYNMGLLLVGFPRFVFPVSFFSFPFSPGRCFVNDRSCFNASTTGNPFWGQI